MDGNTQVNIEIFGAQYKSSPVQIKQTPNKKKNRVGDDDYGNDPWMGTLGRCSDNVQEQTVRCPVSFQIEKNNKNIQNLLIIFF